MRVKSRAVPVVLVTGLAVTGGAAVFAAAGGSSGNGSSSQQQYCPPSSPQGGQPQGGPGNNCGNGTPGGPPEKPPPHKHPHKKPKPRIKAHRHPAVGCVHRNFRASFSLRNVPKRNKARVYRDGHLIKVTSARRFNIVLRAADLSRGRHTITLRVRGADGKWATKKLKFKRC